MTYQKIMERNKNALEQNDRIKKKRMRGGFRNIRRSLAVGGVSNERSYTLMNFKPLFQSVSSLSQTPSPFAHCAVFLSPVLSFR